MQTTVRLPCAIARLHSSKRLAPSVVVGLIAASRLMVAQRLRLGAAVRLLRSVKPWPRGRRKIVLPLRRRSLPELLPVSLLRSLPELPRILLVHLPARVMPSIARLRIMRSWCRPLRAPTLPPSIVLGPSLGDTQDHHRSQSCGERRSRIGFPCQDRLLRPQPKTCGTCFQPYLLLAVLIIIVGN
jgi:hypothetical protein